VVRNVDTLGFQPSASAPIGDIPLKLRAYLQNYNTIQKVVPFVVRVTPCEATIDPSFVQVQNKRIVWGDDALDYPIGQIFAQQYRQVPAACDYPYRHEITFYDLTNSIDWSFTSPPEIIYNPTTNTFVIEKCSARQGALPSVNDPECTNQPYEKVWKITITTWLDGEPRGRTAPGVSHSVSFEVVIGNVCENDYIRFTSQITDFTYNIRSAPRTELFSDYPVIEQDKIVCPVVCELYTLTGQEFPTNLGISFNAPVFSL